MPTFRTQKKDLPFTQVDNATLEDKRLSYKALGLLVFMLRQKNGWDFTLTWLAKQHKDGVDSIASGIRELEAAGYVRRQRQHKADGTFGDMLYFVYEEPQPPETENPVQVAPKRENPVQEKPAQENPVQDNTIPPNTIPPIVPPEGGRRGKKRKREEPKAAPDWKPERFAAFWESYPRGESKQAAIAAWDKLRPDDRLLLIMAKALKRQLESEAWKANIGIPYASTWINQRRWEDEVKKASGPHDEAPRMVLPGVRL